MKENNENSRIVPGILTENTRDPTYNLDFQWNNNSSLSNLIPYFVEFIDNKSDTRPYLYVVMDTNSQINMN